MAKRINKSKKQIVHDIRAVHNAERMRKIVKEKLYPFLLELNNTIGYTKIFLQTSATALDNVYAERQRKTKVIDLMPELEKVFDVSKEEQKEEYLKYCGLYKLMQDETVFDFTTVIQSMPRVIEQYFTHETDKNPVLNIPIDKILG